MTTHIFIVHQESTLKRWVSSYVLSKICLSITRNLSIRKQTELDQFLFNVFLKPQVDVVTKSKIDKLVRVLRISRANQYCDLEEKWNVTRTDWIDQHLFMTQIDLNDTKLRSIRRICVCYGMNSWSLFHECYNDNVEQFFNINCYLAELWVRTILLCPKFFLELLTGPWINKDVNQLRLIVPRWIYKSLSGDQQMNYRLNLVTSRYVFVDLCSNINCRETGLPQLEQPPMSSKSQIRSTCIVIWRQRIQNFLDCKLSLVTEVLGRHGKSPYQYQLPQIW